MTVESSFSTLRKLKTWLCSRMTGDRISALCLINVYHKVDIIDKIDHIIDIFANFKNRRNRICVVKIIVSFLLQDFVKL
jgi:hypothetical protein